MADHRDGIRIDVIRRILIIDEDALFAGRFGYRRFDS